MTSRQRKPPQQQPEPTTPVEEAVYVRAHNEDGTFKKDDPETPENEAWDPPKPPSGIKSRPVTRDAAKPKVGAPQRAPKTVTTPGFGTTKVYSSSPTNDGN
jgi:hypothetical protein